MDQGYEFAEAKSFVAEEPTARVHQVDGRTIVTHGCGLDDAKLRRQLASMEAAATTSALDQLLAA